MCSITVKWIRGLTLFKNQNSCCMWLLQHRDSDGSAAFTVGEVRLPCQMCCFMLGAIRREVVVGHGGSCKSQNKHFIWFVVGQNVPTLTVRPSPSSCRYEKRITSPTSRLVIEYQVDFFPSCSTLSVSRLHPLASFTLLLSAASKRRKLSVAACCVE